MGTSTWAPVIAEPGDALFAHARGLDDSGLQVPHQLHGGLHAECVILHGGDPPHFFGSGLRPEHEGDQQ
jgi:hypothetical protein